ALNRKMKALKKSKKVTKHHDTLISEELKMMFNHKALSINTAKCLQYQVFMWCCLLFAPRGREHGQMKITQFIFLEDRGLRFNKFSQKNDPGGIDGNLDLLIIPVLTDPEGYLGPNHDLKLYLNKRPENCKCEFLYLQVNKNTQSTCF
ncbi:19336_t:CDS:1, partial [Gigaspora margarita]